MARQISEEYYTTTISVLQVRESTKFFDAATEAALVEVERVLEGMDDEPAKGFNALGFLACCDCSTSAD